MTNLIILTIGSLLIWLLFLLLPYLWWKGKREMALHAFVSSLVAWFVAQIVKTLFYFPRPYLTNGETPVAVRVPTDGSFPSGHTAAALALAVSLWLHDGKLGWAVLTVGLAIGAARVAAQIHYPVDILGGAVLGAGVAVAVGQLHLKVGAMIEKKMKRPRETSKRG